MSQPSCRQLRIETNGETGRVGDDCVSQWVNEAVTWEVFKSVCCCISITLQEIN